MNGWILQALCGPIRTLIGLPSLQGQYHPCILYITWGPLYSHQWSNPKWQWFHCVYMCRSSFQLSLLNSNREKKEAPTGERWMKWMMGLRGFVSCPDNSVLQMCTYWFAWFKQWSHFCIFSFHFAFPGRDLSVGSAHSHRGLSIRYSLTTRLIYSRASSKRMESTLAVFIFFFTSSLHQLLLNSPKICYCQVWWRNVWSPLYLAFLRNLTLPAKTDCVSIGFQDISFSWFPSSVQPLLCQASRPWV